MIRTWPRRAAIATIAVTLFSMAKATPVFAGPETTSWWVDPESCPAWTVPLVRQISLACEAAGGTCEVRPEASAASRRIALHCDNAEHWTLEAHDGSGTGLWHIEVRGNDDERIRQAAVWVAREGTELARPAPASPPAKEAPDAPPARPSVKTGGLALAGRVLYQPKPQRPATDALVSYGFSLRAFNTGEMHPRLPRSIQGYLALSGEISAGNDAMTVAALRIGVGAIWHVPGTYDVLRLSLEAGLGYSRMTFWAGDYGDHQERALSYVQGGLTVQAPLSGDFRPFLSLAVGATGPDAFAGTPMGVAEIGCSWIAW